MLSEEYKRKLFLKKAYYKEHPEEAMDDIFRSRKMNSDDFVMKKIYNSLKKGRMVK